MTDEDSGYLATRRAARGGPHPAHQGAAVRLPVQPDRRGLLRPSRSAEIGRWALERGLWVVTDEIYEHLVYGDATLRLDPGARARARRPVRRGQRRRQDLRDDRLAGRLADRPARRRQGGHQPAVARDLERRQRQPGGGAGRACAATCPRWRRCGRPSTGAGRPSSRLLRDIPGVDVPRAVRGVLRLPLGQGRCSAARSAAGDRRPARQLCELVLEEAEVAIVPGEAFGTPGYVRLSYALGDDDLVEGVTRLHKLLAEASHRSRRRRPGDVAQPAGPAGAARRRTCTCTSPGRCAPATLRDLAAQHRVRLPDTLRGRRRPPARAAGHRRAGLVPVPAALRRGPLGGPRRGRRPPAGAARPPRTTARRARAGWRSRSTRRRTRRAWAGSPRPSSSCWTPPARRPRPPASGVGVDHRGQPHPAPAGRPDAGPAGRAVRRRRAWSASGCPTTSGAGRTEDFAPAFRIAARAGLLAGAARRRARRAGAASRPAWTRSGARPDRPRGARGRGPGPARPAGRGRRDPRGVPDVQRRGSASTPTAGRRAAAARCGRPGCRSRSAPTTRCCSARGCWTSTRLAREVHGFDDERARRAGPLLGAWLRGARRRPGPAARRHRPVAGDSASRLELDADQVRLVLQRDAEPLAAPRTGSRGPAPAGRRWWRRRGW